MGKKLHAKPSRKSPSKAEKYGRKRAAKPPKVRNKGIKRYLFTCAQNNTYVHKEFWENLLVLADHYKAELHVSRFLYIKRGLGATGDKLTLTKNTTQDSVWYDAVITSYISDKALQIAPDLIWCGEMNILPTAENPLRGFETYTGPHSGIFPHSKVCLQSLPSMKYERTKMNYTTGACTLRNYISRAAGLKASFHHCFGALLVEVDANGEWFARQINATDHGVICDLDIKVSKGVLTTGNRILDITYGDIHVWQMDPEVIQGVILGEDSLQNTLRPRYQFFHDILDFKIKNHHDKSYSSKIDKDLRATVQDEVVKTFEFLDDSSRPWCKSIVVPSNHDLAFDRWLDDTDYRDDPINARFYLECQLARTIAIQTKDPDFTVMRYLGDRFLKHKKRVTFLKEDESFLLSGIERAMHGHRGPNGSRGTVQGLSKMGRKSNQGHTHTTTIYNGVYVAGMCAKTDLGYNKGPNSHSHSQIVTYSTGKRTIITCRGKRWRIQ